MNAPKISIVIPVYNVARYLRICLASIQAQTFPDWEAVCVDDSSSDECGSILDELAKKDRRFLVVHQENQGVSIARQVALDNCHGEWIGAVDPDDWIEPEHFRLLYEATLHGNMGMVWCDYCRDDGLESKRIQTGGGSA